MLPALDHVGVTRSGLRRGFLGAALLAAVAGLGVTAAEAQYFGRNKVQYETFDFQVLQTEHFDVYFYPEEREAAEMAGRMAERWYARLSRLLDHQFTDRQPLILYASHPDFEQTNTLEGAIGEGTGGVDRGAEAAHRAALGGPRWPRRTTCWATSSCTRSSTTSPAQGGPGGGGVPAALRMPLWFIEGMAEYLSLGPVDAHTAMWMRDAVQRKEAADASGSSAIRATSPTATARRSGPTSAGAGATRSIGRAAARPRRAAPDADAAAGGGAGHRREDSSRRTGTRP